MAEIQRSGGKAGFYRADFTRWPDAEALGQAAINRFGRLDISISNEGIFPWRLVVRAVQLPFLGNGVTALRSRLNKPQCADAARYPAFLAREKKGSNMSLIGSALVLLFAGDNLQTIPQVKEPHPTAQEVRGAVERSLPFLLEGGEVWRKGLAGGGQKGRICVTCHQIPFTIWSHNEAKTRGFEFDQKRLDDLTAWTLDWCAKQKHPKTQTHTGGFLSTMQQLIVGRSTAPPDRTSLETYALFGRVIGTMQKPEGWWKEGNQIQGKGTEREANEVDTMWIILGLTSLEKLDGLPKETRQSSEKVRQRGLKWLKEGKPGARTDWLALRMLVEQEYGDAKQAQEWLKQLIAQQNSDGGWPLMKGEPSHALVTGQSLYALSIAGRTSDDPSVRRAWKYLVDTQEKNGSWKARSRNSPAHSNVVTIHWGTGWATIGLIRTLPK